MREKIKRYLPLLAALGSQLIFSFTLFASRRGMAIAGGDAVKFLSLRFSLAFLIMCLLVLLGVKKVSYRGRPVKYIVAVGLCNPLISQVLETTSTAHAPISQISLLSSLMPIATVVVSIFINKEYPAKRQMAFVAMTMAGLVLVNVAGATASVSPLGLGLIFGSLIVIATSTVLMRRAGVYFSSFETIFITTGMGAFGFSLITAVRYWGQGAAFFDGMFTPEFAFVLLYMAIGSCILGFTMMCYASAHLPVAVFAGTSMLGRIVSMLLGIALGESFGAIDIVGSVIMLLGIVGVSLSYDAGKDNSLHLEEEERKAG